MSLQPDAVQARLGLQQVMAALKEMEEVWSSAEMNWRLLHGTKVKDGHIVSTQPPHSPSRAKRDALTAFGEETTGNDIRSQSQFPSVNSDSTSSNDNTDPSDLTDRDANARLITQVLGMRVPRNEEPLPPGPATRPGAGWSPWMQDQHGAVHHQPGAMPQMGTGG